MAAATQLTARTPTRKSLVLASIATVAIAYVAGVGGWLALDTAPGWVRTLLPVAGIALAMFAILRSLGRLPVREAAAMAAGFFGLHACFWLLFATGPGTRLITTGSACGSASVGDLYDVSDNNTIDCDLTDTAWAALFVALPMLPLLGLAAGFAARAAIRRS
jgi:hypothetical protein